MLPCTVRMKLQFHQDELIKTNIKKKNMYIDIKIKVCIKKF